MAQATDDLNRVAAALRQAHTVGDVYGGAAIMPLQKSLTGDMQQMLMVSFAIVGLVLLVVCANVANLMLLRVTGRSRELAIRLALGAKPINLVRQLVLEGICLGAAAGAAGLAIGAAGKKLLLWQLEWQSPDLMAANLSWAVLLFTFGVSVIVGIVFALLPALAVVRAERHDMLRRASSGTTVDVKGRRLRKALAIAEIACSVVLLAGTILVARSFQALRHVPLGFDIDHRVEVSLPLPRIRYQRDADVARFYQQVTEKVRALPGVMDATTTHVLPLSDGFGVTFQTVEGNATAGEFHDVALRLSDSHMLSALNIPLLRGRFIADTDRGDTAPVCAINKAMAEKYWPDKDPMGRLIVLTRNDVNGEKKPRRIVGVVADVRGRINEDPPPAVYVPYAQMAFFNMEVLVHTRDSVAAVRKSVAAVLQTIDPDQPIRSVHTFSNALPGALGRLDRRHHPAWRARRAGGFADHAWPFRRDRLHGEGEDARNRNQNGHRRDASQRAQPCAEADGMARRDRRRHWHFPFDHFKQVPWQPYLWSPPHRSADVCRGDWPACSTGSCSQLHSRSPRDAGRSDTGVAG